MDADELRATLEDAGFSPYQADAYVTLLRLGSATASDLADASDVPQPRIYDVLRSLEEQGYVTLYDRDRLSAEAVAPAEALSSLRSTVERYEAAIGAIEERYRSPSREAGDVSVVRRFRTVFDHARETLDDAENHVQLAVTADQFRRLRESLRAARERGVRVHLSLYVPPGEPLPVEASAFDGVCHEVRRRDLPGPFLLIVDRKQACYATRGREYGALVDDYTTAYVFHWFFLTRLREVYEVIHDGRNGTPPTTFVSITDCIRALEPALDDGAEIVGRVIGRFVDSGRSCDLVGRFAGVEYTGSRPAGGTATLLELAARATVRFETDRGDYTVGGVGAAVEDVAAERIVVEAVEPERPISPY